MVQFILNNQTVSTELPQGSTVLDFVRYHKRLTGTKIGCREGDCGACTILVGDLQNNNLVYRSMTSCLMPLGNAQGKHIVTVEGINMEKLSPVQQAMVDTNGTQCGFCTLGFVMSFTGFVLDQQCKDYPSAIAAIDGNICRCTGYKSIERSAQLICDKLAGKPGDETIQWLADHQFIPTYFTGIQARLQQIKPGVQPTPSANGKPANMRIGGGTDLVVQRALTVKKSQVDLLYDEPNLKPIQAYNGICTIGASVTVTDFVQSPIIKQLIPGVEKYIKLVSSTPIRNMATLAGNFINASPIGDMTIFFLALNASVTLDNKGEERVIELNHLYKGYKQLNKVEGEIISKLSFPIPAPGTRFNFEKVSKRTHLDIASVNSACQLRLQNDVISSIHLSAGGVAPFPKYLNETVTFLTGKTLNTAIVEEAINIMQSEVAPISDARGTEAYKRLLLRQLFLSHFIKFDVAIESITPILTA
jgi:xanthine dehydrogenase small subunit